MKYIICVILLLIFGCNNITNYQGITVNEQIYTGLELINTDNNIQNTLGVLALNDNEEMIYSGIRIKYFTPLELSFAPGWYFVEDNNFIEFRSSIELKMKNWSFGWIHISEANLHDEWPQSDTIFVGYTWSF